MLRELLDMPSRDYGTRARTETESMEEGRPSSEILLLQVNNTEANVSREKKKPRVKAQHHMVNLIEELSSSL